MHGYSVLFIYLCVVLLRTLISNIKIFKLKLIDLNIMMQYIIIFIKCCLHSVYLFSVKSWNVIIIERFTEMSQLKRKNDFLMLICI